MRKIEMTELRAVEAGFTYDFLDISLKDGTISILGKGTLGSYWLTLCLKPGNIDLQLRESDDQGYAGEELLGLRTIFNVLNAWLPVVFNRWWI